MAGALDAHTAMPPLGRNLTYGLLEALRRAIIQDVLRWLLDRKLSIDTLRHFSELRVAVEPQAARREPGDAISACRHRGGAGAHARCRRGNR